LALRSIDQVSSQRELTKTLSTEMPAVDPNSDGQGTHSDVPWKWIWAVSFMVWPLLALGETIANCSVYWAEGNPHPFLPSLENRCIAFLYSACATPAIYWVALRFPFSRKDWPRIGLIHLGAAIAYSGGGLVFGLLFIPAKLLDNFWVSLTLRKIVGVSIYAFFNDTQSVYILIVAIAHLMSYQRRYREREVRAAQLNTQLAQTQLQFLRSQINPHFLFNSLQSISALMEFDVKAADAMMAQLGDLLRSALDNMENQETTLQSELDFVSKYLNIEQHRLGTRLTVRMDIADDTLDALIPYLILQPLVENAIVHGISKMVGGGELRIQSRRENDDLRVSVRNDLAEPRGESKSWRSIGIGLRNTQERLKQTYGPDHTAEIREVDGHGVEVCLRIPFRIVAEFPDEVLVGEALVGKDETL
jgi:two-component system LytT family sensor kinase